MRTSAPSGRGCPTDTASAASPTPGRSAKAVAVTVARVSQNFVHTQRCLASPQTVPRDRTRPLRSVRKAIGSRSQSAKSFMARTDASTMAGSPVVFAVRPSASSPTVSPSQPAEAVTWMTR